MEPKIVQYSRVCSVASPSMEEFQGLLGGREYVAKAPRSFVAPLRSIRPTPSSWIGCVFLGCWRKLSFRRTEQTAKL